MTFRLPGALVAAVVLLVAGTWCATGDAPGRADQPSPPRAPGVPESSGPGQAVRPAEAASRSSTIGSPSADPMPAIRDAVVRSPRDALAMLEREQALHPEDAHAEERAWLTVDALVHAQQIGRARAAAEDFLRRYPQSKQAERIRALTGVHPRPLGPRE